VSLTIYVGEHFLEDCDCCKGHEVFVLRIIDPKDGVPSVKVQYSDGSTNWVFPEKLRKI
jgi:hypothetical protein